MKTKITLILNVMLLCCNHTFGERRNNVSECSYKLMDISCNIRKTGTFIITNAEEFDSVCHALPPSRINFNKEILIGVIQTTGGCQKPIVSTKILQHNELKLLDCIVSIETFSACRRLFPVIHWFIINKPPEQYSIEVHIVNINNN